MIRNQGIACKHVELNIILQDLKILPLLQSPSSVWVACVELVVQINQIEVMSVVEKASRTAWVSKNVFVPAGTEEIIEMERFPKERMPNLNGASEVDEGLDG